MADHSNIPQELKDLDHWVVAKLVPDPDRPGKTNKLPKSAKTGEAKGWNSPGSLASFAEAREFCDRNPGHVLGFAPLGSPFMAVDFDDAFGDDKFPKPQVTALLEKWGKSGYKELSPSGKGLRLFLRKTGAEDGLSQHLEKQDLGNGASVELFLGGFVTVTGRRLGESFAIESADPKEVWSYFERSDRSRASVESGGRNNALAQYAGLLAKKRLSADEILELVFAKNRQFSAPLPESEIRATVAKSVAKWANPADEIDPDSWRAECKTLGQLSKELPKFLVGGLMPEKCLTALSAHSYNCKTWFALSLAWALAEGSPLWGFEVPKRVPVIYHVPEMNEAWVRSYATTLGMRDTENFVFRAMEQGAWRLDDPRMMRACEGRVSFFDTQGFFNPAEDGNDYRQALRFAELCFNLFNAGCLGAAALFHLAKNGSRDTKGRVVEPEWTLENSIIGSAGYGAILRSCLRMKNLNPDLNDPNVWLYVQGMKNPGLKPFQLEGPMPLKLKVAPGESPYLRELLSGDDQSAKVFELLDQGKTQREISKATGVSLGKVNKIAKQWKEAKEMGI